jgi:hypothetical protein
MMLFLLLQFSKRQSVDLFSACCLGRARVCWRWSVKYGDVFLTLRGSPKATGWGDLWRRWQYLRRNFSTSRAEQPDVLKFPALAPDKGTRFLLLLLVMISTWRLGHAFEKTHEGSVRELLLLALSEEILELVRLIICRITESEYIWFRKSSTDRLLIWYILIVKMRW